MKFNFWKRWGHVSIWFQMFSIHEGTDNILCMRVTIGASCAECNRATDCAQFCWRSIPHHFSPKSVLPQSCRTQQALSSRLLCVTLHLAECCWNTWLAHRVKGVSYLTVESLAQTHNPVMHAWAALLPGLSVLNDPCSAWKDGACTPLTAWTELQKAWGSSFLLANSVKACCPAFGVNNWWQALQFRGSQLPSLGSRGKKKGPVPLSHNTNSNAAPEWKDLNHFAYVSFLLKVGSSCGEWSWRASLHPACGGLVHPMLISHRPGFEVCKVP